MSDLDKLITAVEAGDGSNLSPLVINAMPTRDHAIWAASAFDGSLDAAKRLHDALLPGWGYILRSGSEWDCENHGCEPGDHMAHVMTPDWDSGWKGTGYAEWAMTPARAWLLAILRALKAQQP